jgi:hypothetical protein
MRHESVPGGQADRPRLLCAYCGRTEVPAAVAPGRLPETWWPKCCGQVMVRLGADAPAPAEGTEPEVPSLPLWTDGPTHRTPHVTRPPARRPAGGRF